MAGLDLAPQRPLTKRERQLKSLKFPKCIGMFPDDCLGVTEEEPGQYCKKCTYYKK